jgi:hypothetical protein
MMDIKKIISENPGIIVGGIFLIIGFIIACINLIRILQSLIARSWAATEGKITKSVVHVSRNYSSSGSSGGSGRRQSTNYRPDIEFEYRIQDRLFKSNRIYFGSKMGASWKYRRSKKYVEKYPVGQQVSIYYKPSKHSRAVLEPGIHRELIFGILMGMLILYIGYAILSSIDFPV